MNIRKRYSAVKRELIERCGGKCEACGADAKYPHHIMPVAATGIHAEMAVDPANLMLLCDHCHTLMHPNCRQYLWKKAKMNRAKLLT